MTEQEKREALADIVASLQALPDDARQFLLGYAAGIAASRETRDPEPQSA